MARTKIRAKPENKNNKKYCFGKINNWFDTFINTKNKFNSILSFLSTSTISENLSLYLLINFICQRVVKSKMIDYQGFTLTLIYVNLLW